LLSLYLETWANQHSNGNHGKYEYYAGEQAIAKMDRIATEIIFSFYCKNAERK